MQKLTMPTESLTLKWGSLKAWDLHKPESLAFLRKYNEYPVSMSAIMQRDTTEQKAILCELIRKLDSETIYLDWDGKDVTKDEAIDYIMSYGKES